MRGETVIIKTPTFVYDENKDLVATAWTDYRVNNVLFGRPSDTDIDTAMRLYSVHAQYTLGIPKIYTASLRDCEVYRPRDGKTYVIAGDPQPLPPEQCPTPWNREAIAGWTDG